MKCICLILAVFLICVLSQAPVEAEGFIFRNSQIITSENKQYVFVLLSNENIEQHIEDAVRNWNEVGFTKDEIAKLKKPLVDEMRKERSIRLKYKVSGVFKINSVLPVHIIKDFPNVFELMYVANNGSYVVGLQSHIPFRRIRSDTPQEELIGTSKPALISIVFNETNATYCNAKVKDFVNEKSRIVRDSDAFFWAYDAYLNNDKNVLEIQMLNGEKVFWNIANCKIEEQHLQESEEKDTSKSKSGQDPVCFSLIIITFIIGYSFAQR